MILLKNKNKKANIKIGNNIEIKDGNDFPFDLTLYGKSTQATRSGKNLLENKTKNSGISKGITFTLNGDGSYTLNGTNDGTGNATIFLSSSSNPTTLKAGTYYTIPTPNGVHITGAKIGGGYFQLASSSTNQFTLNEDTQAQIYIQVPNGITTTYNNIKVYPMISTTPITQSDYEPYGVMPSPDYPSPIESVGRKNLFDVTLDSSITNETQYKTYILEPNTKYTISTNTYLSNSVVANIFIDLGTSLTPSSSANGVNGSKTITTDSTGYVTIGYRNYSMQLDYSTGMYYCQLEKGTVATDYVPYEHTEISVEVSGINSQSNSLTIDLQGNELCSLPNGTKDEVNITNGEALLIKRVGKVVLDGSENWTEYVSQTSDGYRVYTTDYKLGLTGTLSYDTFLSNYFQAIPFEQKNSINLTKYATYLNIDNTIANTVAGVKTWLSTNNVEVLYELAEPETINLGTVEMPHTYEGVSNITNSADTEMVVKYYKKFEFDKILRSGYNIDEQEYEIAKKQMANGKRKKILSSYVDCIIKIDLGLLDNKTYQEYKEQLEDGEYEYWSYKYNQYKKANFILTKPSITTEYAYDDDIGIDDMEITLEKSSDVS